VTTRVVEGVGSKLSVSVAVGVGVGSGALEEGTSTDEEDTLSTTEDDGSSTIVELGSRTMVEEGEADEEMTSVDDAASLLLEGVRMIVDRAGLGSADGDDWGGADALGSVDEDVGAGVSVADTDVVEADPAAVVDVDTDGDVSVVAPDVVKVVDEPPSVGVSTFTEQLVIFSNASAPLKSFTGVKVTSQVCNNTPVGVSIRFTVVNTVFSPGKGSCCRTLRGRA